MGSCPHAESLPVVKQRHSVRVSKKRGKKKTSREKGKGRCGMGRTHWPQGPPRIGQTCPTAVPALRVPAPPASGKAPLAPALPRTGPAAPCMTQHRPSHWLQLGVKARRGLELWRWVKCFRCCAAGPGIAWGAGLSARAPAAGRGGPQRRKQRGCPRPGERGRMSGEDGNEEFYRQLQLQQQYEAKPAEGEGEGESDPFTYVDPADGAAYEWDLEKKAWFPKVGTVQPRGRGRRSSNWCRTSSAFSSIVSAARSQQAPIHTFLLAKTRCRLRLWPAALFWAAVLWLFALAKNLQGCSGLGWSHGYICGCWSEVPGMCLGLSVVISLWAVQKWVNMLWRLDENRVVA